MLACNIVLHIVVLDEDIYYLYLVFSAISCSGSIGSYTNDLLTLEAEVPQGDSLPDVCGYVSTPLNHSIWSLLLSEHPDRQFVGYVIRLPCRMPIFSSRAAVSLEQYAFRHSSSRCY